MQGYPHHDQSNVDWSWDGQAWCRGFLETDPAQDNAKEWDHKDHLALDI